MSIGAVLAALSEDDSRLLKAGLRHLAEGKLPHWHQPCCQSCWAATELARFAELPELVREQTPARTGSG